MFNAKLADISPDAPELALYPATVRRALEYLKSTDLTALPNGKTVVDGENLYVLVNEYSTRTADTVILESHRRYVDVQLMLVGAEWMGFRTLEDDLPVEDGGYDDAKDIVFYPKSVMPFWTSDAESPNKFAVHPGEFAIFAPDDIHASQICIGQPASVRKLIAKCRI